MSEVTLLLRAEFSDIDLRDQVFELFNDFDSDVEKEEKYSKRKETLEKYGIKDYSIFSDTPVDIPEHINELNLPDGIYHPSWSVTNIDYAGEKNLDIYLSSGPSCALEILSKVGFIIDTIDGKGIYFIGHNDQVANTFFGYIKTKGKFKICYNSNSDDKYSEILNQDYSSAINELMEANAFFPYVNWLVPTLYYLTIFPFVLLKYVVSWPFKLLFGKKA